MKARCRNSLWFLAAAFLAAGLSRAAEAPPEEIGLAIGQPAPSFTLKDQNGKEVSLESLVKQGPVALVFYRSADWCMFCKSELIHLQRNLKEFQAAGGQIVGISYDSVPILKRFADSQGITFPLLSDEASKTIDAYRARDCKATAKSGYAAHVSLVLDRSGVVRTKLLGVIYKEQPGLGNLLKAVRAASQPQPKAQEG